MAMCFDCGVEVLRDGTIVLPPCVMPDEAPRLIAAVERARVWVMMHRAIGAA